MAFTEKELKLRFQEDPLLIFCLDTRGNILWENQKAKEAAVSSDLFSSLPKEVCALFPVMEKRTFSYLSPGGSFFRFFRFQAETSLLFGFYEQDPFSFRQKPLDFTFLSAAQSHATRKIDDLIFLLDTIEDDVLDGKKDVHQKIQNAKKDALSTLKLIENVSRMVQNENRETLYPVSVEIKRYFDLLLSHSARMLFDSGIPFRFQNLLPQKNYFLYDDVVCSALMNLFSLSCGYALEKGNGEIQCETEMINGQLRITYQDNVTPIDVFMQPLEKYGLSSLLTPVLLSQCAVLHRGRTLFTEDQKGYRAVISLSVEENTALELGNEPRRETGLAYEKVIRNADVLLSDLTLD